MEKVLSLIIPTYNMEKYLNKCLDSLIVENMDLLEVLVINDGSKDNSSKIAHKYETKFPYTFRVIDKENGNYGSCINRGLKEATGKYLKVLDADDYFDKKYFGFFINELTKINSDLILNDFVIVNEEDKEISHHLYPIKSNVEHSFQSIYHVLCKSMEMHRVTYLRENLIKIQYVQTEGISYTDQEWIHLPMTTVNSIYYLNIPLYRYLVGRVGQTMDATVLNKSFKQLNTVILSLLKNYEKYIGENIRKEYLLSRIFINVKSIYDNAILNKTYTYDIIKTFDEEISNWNPAFNDKLNNSIISNKLPFKYIKFWRKHKRDIPLWVRILNKIRLYISSYKEQK